MSERSPKPPDRNPRAILQSLGIDAATTIVPLSGGWSGSTIYRVSFVESPTPDRVLRILPGDARGPQREADIHRIVRHHTIPAPEIVAIGPIPNGTAMLMPLMPGTPLADFLLQGTPTDAAAWGTACGAMLARIHAIPTAALDDLDIPSWLASPSPAVMHVLEPWLTDTDDRQLSAHLLHLDFHPANLLGDADTMQISAVLDWTNARLGPPITDLARTRSILRMFASTGLPASALTSLAAFASSLQDAWEHHLGPVEPARMRAFDAWALDMQIADLAPKLTMPGSWVSESLLDTLRASRDAAIATSLADRQQ